MSSKDKARLSRELQTLPSDWRSILDLENDPMNREPIRCPSIAILEADEGFLDQVEHLELHELLKIEVGFHSGSDLRV